MPFELGLFGTEFAFLFCRKFNFVESGELLPSNPSDSLKS